MATDSSQSSSVARCSTCGEASGVNHQCKNPFQGMIGQTVDGRYEVKKILGQGGMGVVFLATQTSMKRDVAMKMLHPSLATTPLFAERFRREAEVVSRLKHPNIISVFEFGQTPEGHFYYVMELLEGENLKSMVKRDGPMTLARAAAIVEQIGSALAYAHSQNILHRDMKPHNVMCARFHGKDFIKVLDFGLVKMVDEEQSGEENLTTTGQILGTPAYMSPEQAAGDPLDGRSDLYSLGVVFYYLLAGSTPFKANSAQKLLAMAMTEELPAIATRRKGAPVPEAVETFIKKALNYHRDDRPADVEAFLQELKEALQGLPPEVLEAIPEGAVAPPPADNRTVTSRRLGSGSGGSKVSKVVTNNKSLPTSPSGPSGSLPPPSTGRSLMLGAGIGLGAVLLLGGGYLAMAKHPAAPTPTERPVVKFENPVNAAPVAPPQPAQPETISVAVTSEPAGAEIYDGANLLGQAPAKLLLPRSRGAVNLTLKLAGYQPLTQGVDLAAPTPELKVKLVAEAPAEPKQPEKAPEQPSADRKRPNNGGKKPQGGKSDIPVFE